MNTIDRSKYKISAVEELSSLLDQDSFEIIEMTDVPTNEKVLTTTWKVHIKLNDKFKARLIARGYQQPPGVDY
jgi:hypothetical protein